MDDCILAMQNISKIFPGVKALDDVTFNVRKNEIHALVGENGAGKSTLMKVLSGVYPAGTYTGDILLDGAAQSFSSIKDSVATGVAIIYQELALVKNLDIVKNIFLGMEKCQHGTVDYEAEYVETKRLLGEVGLDVEPHTKVVNLGIGQQQLIEIAKAMAKDARILILDEPTAALTEAESENLLALLKTFKKKGVTCIYISHKLNEVFSVADRITVLRDGKTIATKDVDDIDENGLIALMVGRSLSQRFPSATHTVGETVLEVNNWTVYNPELPGTKRLDDVSFFVKAGEILGVAGLMGAGRTELAMSIFGCYGDDISGELILNGKPIRIRNPRDAIRQGISYLSEDRKGNGLVLGMDIKNNISLSSIRELARYNVINENEQIRSAERLVGELRIKTPSIEQKVGNLSGGNQQKVVFGKWLMTNPKVLILDEPTRGVDVGAKYEIYGIMQKLAGQGVSIVMISSELPEILGMSDRILVMHEGRIAGTLTREEATQEKVMFYATGGR